MFPERFYKIIQFLSNGQTATYTKGAGLQGITYLRNGETYVFISANDDDHIVCDGVVATTAAPPTPPPIAGATKLGDDIDGESVGDQSGYSVSLSSDGSRVAIGARYNDGDGYGGQIFSDSGHVRVYDWSGSAWTQVGADIDGEATRDYSGQAVSLSNDGSRLAIGAPRNDVFTNGVDFGHVRIYDWSGSAWTQVGADIDGVIQGIGSSLLRNDYSGQAVSLSGNGSRVAIGAPFHDTDGSGGTAAGGNAASNIGCVRIYGLSGSSWIQLGSKIIGSFSGDESGSAVSLNDDGSIVAIGGHLNDDNGFRSGNVRIFQWDGSSWNQLGANINGKGNADRNGWSVSLSSDGSRVAIGAKGGNYAANRNGYVRVYDWSGSAWIQAGSDIDGESVAGESGYSVSLSSDGSRVAIGAPMNDDGGSDSGHVRIYDWIGADWTKVGGDIDGTTGDRLGHSVSLNSDGETVAIGGVPNDNLSYGLVRVYQLGSISNTTTTPPPPTLTFRNIVGDNGCNGSLSEFPKCIPCSPTSSSHVVKTKEEDGVITFKVSVSVTNPNTSQLQYIWEYKSYTTECSSGDWTRFGTSNSSANQYGVTTAPTVDFNYNCVVGQSLRLEVRCTALMGWEDTRTISNSYYYKCDNQIDTSELVNKFNLLVSTPEDAPDRTSSNSESLGSQPRPAGFTQISRGFVLDDKQYNSETEQCEYSEYGEGYHLLSEPSDRLGDRSLLQLPFSESTKEAIRQIGEVIWFMRRPSDGSKSLTDTPSTFEPLPTNATVSFPSTTVFQTLASYHAGDDPTTLNLSSIPFSALHTGVYEIKAVVKLGGETYSSSVVPVFSTNFKGSSYGNSWDDGKRGLVSLSDRSWQKYCINTANYPSIYHPSVTADIAIYRNKNQYERVKQNVYVAPKDGDRNFGLFEHLFPRSSVYLDGQYVSREQLRIVYSERSKNSPSGRSMYRTQDGSDTEGNPVLIDPENLNTLVWGFYDPKNPICVFGRYYPHNSIQPWNNGIISPLNSSKYNANATDPYPAQISPLTNTNGKQTLVINLKKVQHFDNADLTYPDIVVFPMIEYSNDGGANWWRIWSPESVVKKNNHWQSTVLNSYSSGARGWYSGTLIRYTPTGFAGLLGETYDISMDYAGAYPGIAKRQLTDPSIPLDFIYGYNNLNVSRYNIPLSPFSQTYSIP